MSDEGPDSLPKFKQRAPLPAARPPFAQIPIIREEPPISVRTAKWRAFEAWSPKGILTALATVLAAVGGPTMAGKMIEAWSAQSKKLDAIQESIDAGQLRTSCLMNRLQSRQAVTERNVTLSANFISELNGGPPNDSFPHDEIKTDKPLKDGPITFGARWEDFPEQEPCPVLGSGGAPQH